MENLKVLLAWIGVFISLFLSHKSYTMDKKGDIRWKKYDIACRIVALITFIYSVLGFLGKI